MEVHDLLMDLQYYWCVANEYGNYFSNLSNKEKNDEFKRNYIRAINELCISQYHEIKCKLMDLHIITNSVNQDKKTTLVDVRMRDSLKLIYEHKELNKFCM